MIKEDLVNFRKEFKISRRRLANFFKCHTNTIANYENGKSAIPYSVQKLFISLKEVYECTRK